MTIKIKRKFNCVPEYMHECFVKESLEKITQICILQIVFSIKEDS